MKLNSDKIISAIRGTDFLCGTDRRLVRFEKPNRFFNGNLKVAFFIGGNMKVCYRCKQEKPLSEFRRYKSGMNKGSYYSYCENCEKIADKEYRKRYKQKAWRKTYQHIWMRCNWKEGKYHKRKIKNYLTLADLKFLWLRDKAYLMKQPSIDRINTEGNYTLKNCRYIELLENQRRKKAFHTHKKI